MWLLFLNSLKGIGKKKLQMVGLIFLILISTGIYTTMNSALDRMDDMSLEYMETQQVEHMTIFLNESELLSREQMDFMFGDELYEEWQSIASSLTPIPVTDEMLLAYDESMITTLRTTVRQAMIAQLIQAGFSSSLAEQMATPVAVDALVKTQLGKILAASQYILGIVNGTYPINDVNTYLFYGCTVRANDPSYNQDPLHPWNLFCPIQRPEGGSGEDDEPVCDNDPTSQDITNSVTQISEHFTAMKSDPLYGVNKYEYLSESMDELAQKYHFNYELRPSKVISYEVEGDSQNYVTSAMIYHSDSTINKPYLIAGRFPTDTHEITVSDAFAYRNDIELGDFYLMDDITYTIVGLAYAPDYIYPAISFNTPLYDAKRHTVMYMTSDSYEEMNGKESLYYSGRFLNYTGSYTSDELDELVNEVQDDKAVLFVMSTATLSPRISMFTMEIENNRTFTSYLMLVLLVIATFIIVMVMKKRIEDERLQIGVLKSLGYKTFSIAAGYLVYPVVGSLLGGALGYGFGVVLQGPVVELYRSFYNIPINDFFFDSTYLMNSILIPLALLVTLSYLVALIMLRHRPLKLLREGSHLKVNAFSRFTSRMIRFLPFKSRFRYSLAFRSIGKLVAITFCSFATGLLIVLTLIGATMMNKMIDKTFGNMRYQYQISYTSVRDPQRIVGYDENHEGEDLILSSSLTVVSIERTGKEAERPTQINTISLRGVGADLSLLSIRNSNSVNLHPLLSESLEEGVNPLIVNDTVKVLYQLQVGDELLLSKQVSINDSLQCGDQVRFRVVGIDDSFNGLTGYVDRSTLAQYLGYSEGSYTTIYSTELQDIYDATNPLIRNIFRYNDLKENLAMMMEMMNYSLYLVIAFAGAMALVIISVVSNIVVDENRKHISLMKVMGYREKEIKSVVLNIYTPFVLFAYLISIPSMIGILKYIISLLAQEISFSAPIELSWTGALIGGVVIMGSYFIALQLSRRALNQVPLSEALKRE